MISGEPTTALRREISYDFSLPLDYNTVYRATTYTELIIAKMPKLKCYANAGLVHTSDIINTVITNNQHFYSLTSYRQNV